MMDRLARGHKFRVCFGPLLISFSKITGIGNELEVTQLNEGGRNNGVVMLYSPKKTVSRLVFEHGTGIANPANIAFEAAALGYYFNLPGLIVAYDSGDIKRAYAYSAAAPVKWSLSAFDAQNGSILIDTIEVMHNGIYEVPI